MPYIVSKLSAGVDYVMYSKPASGKHVAEGAITVKGGADVIDRRTLVTPEGVVTPVTAEELKKLKNNPVFNDHVANHMLIVTNAKPEPAAVAADLKRDESSQLTPQDYTAAGKEAPKTGEA